MHLKLIVLTVFLVVIASTMSMPANERRAIRRACRRVRARNNRILSNPNLTHAQKQERIAYVRQWRFDCTKFVLCGAHPGQDFLMSCPAGLGWNRAFNTCDFPSNLPECPGH
uniref:Carbohydrate binding domain containing secreted protein n=1 Tax=Clytia hemisphaerica TaxID=252671 RepID=A0A069DMZ8_9CNID